MHAEQGRLAEQKAIAALRPILKAAVEWGVVESNPITGLRLPHRDARERERVERVLSAEQLSRLFAEPAQSPHVEPMLRLASESALRRGEVIGARWTDVDLPNRRINVARSVWQASAADKRVKPPKSGRPAGWRVSARGSSTPPADRWSRSTGSGTRRSRR